MIKKIAFDIDGTIADTPNYIVTSFMNCYNLEFGHPYTGKIVWTSPEIRDMFPDCQRDYIDKWENEHMWNREYYLNVPCRPGVKKLFDWLHRCNVEIHIITARHPEPGTPETVIEECTKEWCKRCGLDVDSFHIGFANKDSIVASHGIEIMVEDNYDISVEVAQKIPVILVDTEYNKKVRGGNIFHLKPTELDPVYFKKMLDYIEDHVNNDTIEKTEMTTESNITVAQITKDIIILKPKVFSKNVMLAVPLGSGDNLAPLHDLMRVLHIKRLVDLSHLNSMQDLKQDSFIRGIILSEKMSEADVFTIPENTTAGYIAKTELIKKIIRRAAKLGDTIVYGAELALLSRDDAKEFKKYTMMFTNPSENDKKIITDGKYKAGYDNFRILEDLTQATDGTTYKWRIIKDTALHELKDYRNRMYVTTEGVYDVDFLGNEAPYHPERFDQYVTMNTYLITDPHIGRNDMKKFNMMISNINSKVGPNDTLLVLGDWDGKKGSGGLDMVKKFCKRLKTRKILTLIGNNDPWEIKDLQRAGGFLAIDCKYTMRHDNIDIIFSHCPININRGEINIHGHMHGSCNYWNIDWHNHVDVWDENFNPITVADAIDLIRTGKYKAKSTIHDFR